MSKIPINCLALLFFLALTSLSRSQEIKIDSIYFNELKIEAYKDKISWRYKKDDTLEIFIEKKEVSDLFDYNKDTFILKVENISEQINLFEVQFCNKSSEPIFSFEFNNQFKGIRKIIRSFRYDMERSDSGDSISKINIISKTSIGEIKLLLPLFHVKRSEKRIKTNYNFEVRGFYSDTSYYYYYKKLNNYANDSIDDKGAALKNRYLNILYAYQPGFDCILDKEVEQSLSNTRKRLINFLLEKESLNPEIVGPDLLSLSKGLFSGNHPGKKKDIEIVSQIIKWVFYNGFGDNTQELYNQYKIREYFQSLLLCYDLLDDDAKNMIRKTLRWHLRTSIIFETNPRIEPVTSDIIRNRLLYVLGYIIIVDEGKISLLNRFSDYLSFLILNSDFNSWLKVDGSAFHHKAHNIPYSYSLNDLSLIVQVLNDTEAKLGQKALKRFVKAVIATFLMSKNGEYTNNISGRHPFDNVNPVCDNTLKSLLQFDIDSTERKIIKYVLDKELNLQGFWAFNYSNLAIFKKNNFHVAAKGFSSNFWGSEIYEQENRYGRYQGYGTLEIINDSGFLKSGFSQEGWDWNRPPGSTTIILPLKLLEPNKPRVDEYTERNFAGAVSFGNRDDMGIRNGGIFVFDFKEKSTSDHHSNSFSFKKSYYFFEDFVLALGSNIKKDSNNYYVNTNILQKEHLSSGNMVVNNMEIKQGDRFFFNRKKFGNLWIRGNDESYFIYDYKELIVSITNQNSESEDKSKSTHGIFNNVYINHNKSPNNEGYEYLIFLKASKDNIDSLKYEENLRYKRPYEVLQKNEEAHVVKISKSDRFNYVIFKPYITGIKDDILLSTSSKILISLIKNKNEVELSASNPSIYFDYNNKIEDKVVSLKLRGKYYIKDNEDIPEVNISYDSEYNTIIELLFSEGKELHFDLTEL